MVSVYEGYKLLDTGNKITYFAGANTGEGFVGSYENIANENNLDKVYIIKGGPGTGKSSMMRKIAKETEENGIDVKYYLCGSDPSSLDCIVIGDSIAVLDGTAPHVKDMKYPGAKSTLIDLSKLWNETVLEESADEIISNSAHKSLEYSSAYRYLKAADQIERDNIELSNSIFDYPKAEAFIGRFIKKLGKPKNQFATAVHRYTSGITIKGQVRVNTIYDIAETHFIITDYLGCASLFMKLMQDKLLAAGYTLTVGHVPLSGLISEIFVEDVKLSMTVDGGKDEDRKINLGRFVIADKVRQAKGKLKLAGKCRDGCINASLTYLKRAAAYHFALEEIYKTAMNYDALSKLTAKISKEIIVRQAK